MPSPLLGALWNTLTTHSSLEMTVSSTCGNESSSFYAVTIYTATAFAVEMGFTKEDLHSDYSRYQKM